MHKMLPISVIVLSAMLVACDPSQPQYATQPQYASQPQPQVVYQQQPSSDHSLAAGVLGAAVGAAAATAYHNSKTPAAPAPQPQYSAGTPRQYNAAPRTPAPQPATVVQRSVPAPKPAVAPKPAPAPKPVFTPSKVVAPRTSTKGK